MARIDLMKEYGVSGAPEFSGRFVERYSSKLQGSSGVSLMAEVLRREPSAYSLHNAVLLTAQRSNWKVVPASNSPSDIKAAEFLETCMGDMSNTWWDFVKFALSSIPFGFADVNIVFKRRLGKNPLRSLPKSKYDDGLVGIRKLAPRRQETIDRWEFDENGGPQEMVQINPSTGEEIKIPIKNIIHFISGDDRGGWEGLGWLEPGYNLAHLIWNLEVFAGIGWQRSLVGVPMFEYIEVPGNSDKTAIENMLRGLIVNKNQYVTTPAYLGKFSLLTVENTNADSLLGHISQLRWEMLMLGLGTYLRLGSTVSGSRALSFPLIEMFRIGVNGNLDIIKETLNAHLIPRLFAANADTFGNLDQYPTFEHSTVLDLPPEVLDNLGPIQEFLANADKEDERWLRDLVTLPIFDRESDGNDKVSTESKDNPDDNEDNMSSITLGDIIKERIRLSYGN